MNDDWPTPCEIRNLILASGGFLVLLVALSMFPWLLWLFWGAITLLLALESNRWRHNARLYREERDQERMANVEHIERSRDLLDKLSTLHKFEVLEAIATELELLADGVESAPRHAVIVPKQLELQLRTRIRHLRRLAPNPPAALSIYKIEPGNEEETS